MTEWISVNDRLPEKGVDDWVLVLPRFVPEGGFSVPLVARFDFGKWHGRRGVWEIIDKAHCNIEVAYWSPLPKLPKEDEDPC